MSYGYFSADDAKRIARTVRAAESNGTIPPPSRPARDLPPMQSRRFELKDDLVPGESATAWLLLWSESDGKYLRQIDEFEVHDDLLGNSSGKGADDEKEKPGTYGFAMQFYDGRWEIVAMQPMAMRCNCFLKEAMIPGNSTKTVYHIVALDGGISPLNDPDSITEELPNVANTFAWSGDIDAPCKIEWNATLKQWEFYQVKCPT